MSTLTTLSSEIQQMKADLQQLRGHVDQQNAIQAETSAHQTTKTMSLDDELGSLYGNAEAAIRAINVDIAAMKEDKGNSEKDWEKYW